ncbi:MAG: vWA domain-containing protein [Chitinophagales bacterium]
MQKPDKREGFNASGVVGNYLNIYFSQEQGVRLGESCVVSLKAHQIDHSRKSTVKVLTNRDAGQRYLDFIDPGQVVHLDVFHKPGTVNPRNVAKRIFWAIEEFLIEENPRMSFLEDERFNNAVDYALKIQVVTRGGMGLVYDLFQGNVETVEEEIEATNHVRVLIKINSEKYGVILPVADAVEQAVVEEGLELAKIKRISHNKEKEQKEDLTGFIIFPWKKLKNATFLTARENKNQLLMKLVDRFGSVEELEDFLQAHSANIFKRKSQEEQKRKWGNLEQELEQMEDLGIIKKTILGPVLTKDGKDLQEFLMNHKCELEAELRRSIRHTHRGSGKFHQMGQNNQKSSVIQFNNRNKVISMDDTWSGNLAVPETIIQAKKSGLLRNEDRLRIRKEDLQCYSKRSYVPMDVCLLIDASMSMAGEKRQAACYLAEHLLLTGREKVAVVTFQEMAASVAVPFTKNQQTLSRGLRSVRPGGMTPLADGIITSVELIKATKVDNPVLILITDGMPNFPLWSFDAKKDAIEAAQKVADNKIRFICIGVESNQDYLKDLADIAKGKLYVVDDLNRNNLIDIVKYERKTANLS